MAMIGMQAIAVSPISSVSSAGVITYGTGVIMGKAISASLTINRNQNPLYADDGIAEDDNSISSMELELGLDDLSEEIQNTIGLVKKVTTGTGTGTVTVYQDTGDAANDVGVGYVRVRQKNGTISAQLVWYQSVKFSINSESSNTKGENIDWQTPTVSGRCKKLGGMYRYKQNFEGTGAVNNAIAALETKAGVVTPS